MLKRRWWCWFWNGWCFRILNYSLKGGTWFCRWPLPLIRCLGAGSFWDVQIHWSGWKNWNLGRNGRSLYFWSWARDFRVALNSCCFGVDGWSLVASDAGLSEAFNLPARDEPFNRPPLSEDFALWAGGCALDPEELDAVESYSVFSVISMISPVSISILYRPKIRVRTWRCGHSCGAYSTYRIEARP